MELTRRKILAIGSGTLAFAGLSGLPAFASLTDDAIAALTGGAELGEGGVEICDSFFFFFCLLHYSHTQRFGKTQERDKRRNGCQEDISLLNMIQKD